MSELSFDDLIPASKSDESDLSFDDLIPEQQADAELSFDDLVPESPVMPAPAAAPQPVDMQGRIRELLEQEGQYQTALGEYNNQYQQWEQGFMDQRAFNPAAIPDAQPEQPVIPVRDQAQLLADFEQGIPFIRAQELAQLISGIELGQVSPEQSQAIRQLLSTQLGPQGERAFDMAEITRGLYQQQLAEKEAMGGIERRADVLGRDLAKSATLGYAYSPDEDRLNSEDLNEAAAERALQLIRDTEADKYWGSSITGNMAGFMVPYAGAVKLLRMARVARGLAPVEAGITGAMKEGAIAGSAVDLLTRPEGAESMGAAQNVMARVTQAGIGAAIGAVADAGLLKLSDWISFRMQARKDKKLQQQIKKEAKEAGYENPDDYLDSLIELVDTENGTAIRGRTDFMDDLPEVDEVPAGPSEQFVPGMAQQADKAANPLQAEQVNNQGSVSAVKPPFSTVTTIRGTPVEVDYQIVDADDLVTSHLGNGVENPDYPSELQPRDRSRGASEAQLRKLAANLRPEWLGASPKASDGAPIVGDDGVVESGNGRVSAMRYAYASGNGEQYKQWLKESAGFYGIDPAAVDGMKKPVLVRRRSTPMDMSQRAQFAREANQSDIASLSPAEQARMDADRLTEEDLLMFAPDEQGQINVPQNDSFLRRFADRLGELEAGSLVDGQGRPNADMVRRVQAAVFTKAYDDDRLLSLMAEEANPDSRNILSALNQAAPSFARARSFDPGLGGESNFVPNLMEAVELVRQSRRDKQALSEVIDQGRLVDSLDPATEQLARFFDDNMRSSNRMGATLRELGQQLEQEAARGGDDLFGAAPASKQDFITTTNRNLENRYGENSPSIPQTRQKTGEADPEFSGETLQGNPSGESAGNGRATTGNARTASVAESGVRESGTVEKAEVFSQGNIKQDGLTELGRTVRHVKTATLPTGIKTVSTAGDVAHVTAPYRKEAQETFLTVITDDAGKVLRVARLHTGGKAGAAVEPATVAGVATNTPGAKKAWFVHNHPSGDVIQSAADKQLTARLDDLLDGSGIESGGMVTIGPDAKYSYHQPTDRQGFTANESAYDELDMDGELAQPIPAKARRESVPVTERRLAGKGNSTHQSITSGDQVEQYFAANPDQKEGIVLLDTMKRPVGWLPMSRDTMTRMRNGKGGGSDQLLKAIDRTNATAIAARVDSGRLPDLSQVAGNLDGFSKVAGVEFVDVADQAGQALGKRQDLPSQSTFYSNPINVAAREIAKDLGLEQGVAAAGGAVYGGVSSDEELGSAKWWLDVAAGAGAAAVVSAGLKGAGVTGKDGFLSRHLSRLGHAIDELPLIGRGNSEVRELKQRQKLMKQILDRQTEEMGAELLKRFAPSERAMMSDLIESKGIIKDFNLIHRQAAELDEFITYTSEKLKSLGMLPPDLETGGYLHRYYSKHLKIGDKLFKGAKKQTMSGSYSIARGSDDTFSPEYLSGDARRVMGEMDTLNTEIKKLEAKQHDLLDTDTELKLAELKEQRRELQETKLREYIGMENGKPKSFIFTEHEAVDTAGQSMPRGDLIPAGDVRPHQFEATDRVWSARGTVNGKAMLHRDWTKAERQSWGEIEDAGYRFVRGQAEVAHDLSLATFFKKVADNSGWVSDTDPGGWHYVSDQKVGKNSPLKKYGALAGKYVDPKIWAAVRHHGRAPFGSGRIATTYRGLLNRWKLYKTVYNPVTHFNNTWSNTEMYFMGGYEAKHIASAVKALRGKEKSELWTDARDAGLFGQDWSNSILQSNEGGGNSVLDELAEKLRTQPEIPDAMEVTDAVMRFKEWWINSKQAVKDADTRLKTGLAVAKAVGQPASMLVRRPLKAATQSAQKLYQLEDELFKLAAFAQERAAGKSRREAVNAANRFFFDYNDLPEGVKIVRDFPIGSPFISYSYLALPAIVKTAVEKPERLLALAAMYEAVNFAGMTVNDDLQAGEYWQRMSDEDALSPHWNKGRALWGARNAISVPYLEGYRVSFANAHALGNPFAGESGDRQFAIPGPLQSFWGSDIFGGNPFRALLDVVGNEDWKGKEIVSPEASDEEKYKAYLAYLYQAWAPSNPLTPGSYHQEKIIEGLANDVNQARAKGEKANGLAEGVVDMANGITSALGFEQFTGVNGSGNEILTRDSALGSVGIKLRPMRPDQFMRFEIQDITAKQKKLDRDLKKLSERYGKGRVTEKQLAEKQAFHQKQTEKNTKELQELIDAWNGLQRK